MNGFDDFDTQIQCDELTYSFEDMTPEELEEFHSFLDEIEAEMGELFGDD